MVHETVQVFKLLVSVDVLLASYSTLKGAHSHQHQNKCNSAQMGEKVQLHTLASGHGSICSHCSHTELCVQLGGLCNELAVQSTSTMLRFVQGVSQQQQLYWRDWGLFCISFDELKYNT